MRSPTHSPAYHTYRCYRHVYPQTPAIFTNIHTRSQKNKLILYPDIHHFKPLVPILWMNFPFCSLFCFFSSWLFSFKSSTIDVIFRESEASVSHFGTTSSLYGSGPYFIPDCRETPFLTLNFRQIK